eukprot:1979386-Rhodomonas_salina.1
MEKKVVRFLSQQSRRGVSIRQSLNGWKVNGTGERGRGREGGLRDPCSGGKCGTWNNKTVAGALKV